MRIEAVYAPLRRTGLTPYLGTECKIAAMLTIGQLAERASVGVETIRFYERKGLIIRPGRPSSGFRRYDEDIARRIEFIRHAQELGFSLREIRDLLTLRVDPKTTCAEVKQKTIEKIEEVDQKLKSLSRIRAALAAITRTCAGEGPTSECPILDALDGQSVRSRTQKGK